MHFPNFFDAAPTIAMHDPLAEFLGACEGGLLEYRYADAVALAGHSCPTVAVAFLMTRAALRSLYAAGIPERGGICAEFRDGESAGTTGVIANVVSLITGVTQKSGFKGIGGHYDRRNSLFFDCRIATARFSKPTTLWPPGKVSCWWPTTTPRHYIASSRRIWRASTPGRMPSKAPIPGRLKSAASAPTHKPITQKQPGSPPEAPANDFES